jgi:signal transduction histidine kinase
MVNINNDSVLPDGGEGHAHLSISAHVVVQLGEELVTDIEQALLELAKNAYDADSENCEIIVEPDWQIAPSDAAYKFFSPDAQKSNFDQPKPITVGRLRVRDYGRGLSAEAVQNGWLRISASLKRANDGKLKGKTKKGRTPVGDKGLGRLATMKIGKVLRMKTATEGESSWRTVMFSWADFTHERTLDEVPVQIEHDDIEAIDRSGTVIEIMGLREANKWRDVRYVEHQLVPNLSSLVNPFRTNDKFDITVHSSGRRYELHSLNDEVFNLASAKFSFVWDGRRMNQRATFAPILFRGERGEENEKRFSHLFSDAIRSKLVEWLQKDKKLKEKGISFDVAKPWFCRFDEDLEGQPFPQDRQYPGAIDPGPFEANIFYFMFHQSVKNKLSQAHVSPATLQAMSQVAIYRDGFRVRAQRDWLRLADSTTSGSSYYGLRPNNVIGHFSVTNDANAGLIEKSDREGFVDNPAFHGFMILGLRVREYANAMLEAIRKSVREFEKSLVDEDAPPNRKQLVSSLSASRDDAEKGLGQLEAELKETQRALSEARENAKRLVSSPIRDSKNVSFSRSVDAVNTRIIRAHQALATIGLSVQRQTKASMILADLSVDDHEYAARLLDAAAVGLAARSLSHELHEYLRQLRNEIIRISKVNKQLGNSEIAEAIRNLNGTTRELEKTIATIDPLLPGTRSIKENINLGKFIEEFILGREAAARRNDISIFFHSDDQSFTLVVRFSRTRLLQVIENLFQNSLYWLRRGPLPERNLRCITVTMTESGFRWADSGPGIKPSIESSIFDPYVSDKPSSEGQGLGLHVVATFLELEKCSIRLSEKKNCLGRRCEFEIDLTGAQSASKQQKINLNDNT